MIELADTPRSRMSADLGYTHVELMPINRNTRSTTSWGYQPIGLFAPSSPVWRRRLSLRVLSIVAHRFRDRCNSRLGACPFPDRCRTASSMFDGTALYEHMPIARLGFHPDWNTAIYNFGRVGGRRTISSSTTRCSGSTSYHIDGLRVDAVASMLYRDYSRQARAVAAERAWRATRTSKRSRFFAVMNETVCYHAASWH